jgi:hypothetical protein
VRRLRLLTGGWDCYCGQRQYGQSCRQRRVQPFELVDEEGHALLRKRSVASKMTTKGKKGKKGDDEGIVQLAGSHDGWGSCNCAASCGRARRLKAWVGEAEER